MKRIAPLLLTALLLASCATSNKTSCMQHWQNTNYEVFPNAIYKLCVANGIDHSKVFFCIVDSKELIMQVSDTPTITASTEFIYRFMGNSMLSCAVAHELAHYKLSHISKREGAAVATSLAFTIANVFIPGIALADYLVTPTVSMAFSRSFELDADVEAVRMCKNAGIEDAAVRYIQMLERFYEGNPEGRNNLDLTAAHPPGKDRIAAIRAAYPE